MTAAATVGAPGGGGGLTLSLQLIFRRCRLGLDKLSRLAYIVDMTNETRTMRYAAQMMSMEDGGYRLEALRSGRWVVVMFGLTLFRAQEYAQYYPEHRIVDKAGRVTA